MSNATSAVKPVVAAAVAHPVKAAKYAETAVITVTDKGRANPKRAASAKRYAVYLAARKEPLTIKAYLDECALLQPEEPRYRWRADISWDLARGFITVA